MRTVHEPEVLRRQLQGGDGPAARLFVEFAAKYGLPIGDWKVPLATELHVMLQDWRVHLFDVSKTNFHGAIGFRKETDCAWFCYWLDEPTGARQGYVHVGDDFPILEVKCGAHSDGMYRRRERIGTRIHIGQTERFLWGTDMDRRRWEVFAEILKRAVELGEEYGYVDPEFP